MTIRELRTAAGLTQAQLAEASGVNIRQIQKIESGEIRTENITLGNAIKLARALGAQPEALINSKEE